MEMLPTFEVNSKKVKRHHLTRLCCERQGWLSQISDERDEGILCVHIVQVTLNPEEGKPNTRVSLDGPGIPIRIEK